MKKSLLFVALVAILSVSVSIAQKTNISIDKRWEKVNELAEKQLPESALKEVEAILAQAQKEKNSVQVIKAMVYKMRFTLEKEPDKAPELIKDFEAFTEKSTDPAERALLHSMTAELYAQYYQKEQWTINNRTDITGSVPDDMKEWTKNIYYDKVTNHLAASLENPEVLQKTDALKYSILLITGNDSRVLQPTLYDFLERRKISVLKNISETLNVEDKLVESWYFAAANQFAIQPIDTTNKKSIESLVVETYQQMLAFRLKAKSAPALLNLDLERLEYFHSNSQNEQKDSLYLAALTRLEEQYFDNESVVEVLAEIASYYFEKAENSNYEGNHETAEVSKFKRKAYDICALGIKRYPKYKRIGLLHNIQGEIVEKKLAIDYKKLTRLNSKLQVTVNSKNVSLLQLSVYRVNASALDYYKYKMKETNDFYSKRTLVESRKIMVKPDANFGNVKSEILIVPNEYGIYEFCIELPGDKRRDKQVIGSFVVSDLAFLKRVNTEKNVNLYVLDGKSGNQISNVQVTVFNQKWHNNGYKLDSVAGIVSDEHGACTYVKSMESSNNIYFLRKGKDAYFSSQLNAYFSSNLKFEDPNAQIDFFTDRSLYRPEQTVYFKGIAHYSNSTKQEVASGKTFVVNLLDANSQKVNAKSVTSNQFGSFTGEFVLPEGGLNGLFTIQTTGGSLPIWVEEYKRPTFEVLLEKPKAEIMFGDKVRITGTVKAYAGYNVNGADVKYRVVRSVHHYCWWFSEPEDEVASGLTKSNDKGVFEVSFVASKGKSNTSFWADRAYSYAIYTDVTDPKGETQQGETTVSVADKSLFIIAEIPEKINKSDKNIFGISTETINDEKINSTLNYAIYKLQETDVYAEKLDGNKELKVGEKVLSGSYETKNKDLFLDLKGFTSGRYRVVFTTFDAHKKEVKLEKTFVLYGLSDKQPPVKCYAWFLSPKTECQVGESAQVQFGTSTKNSKVLYEIMKGNIVLESSWIPFSDEIKTFNIPYKDSYGAGVTVMFTFMKDEQLFTQTIQLTRKVGDKKLTPTLSIFRNKLLPREKADWTITIPETAQNRKQAELLVGMYDASLDAIRPHSWNFDPTYFDPVFIAPQWQVNSFDIVNAEKTLGVKYLTVDAYSLDMINWFGLDINGYYHRDRFGTHRQSVKFTAPVIKEDRDVSELKSQDVVMSKGIVSIATVVGGDDTNGKDIADIKVVTGNKPIQLRTNFNETAFFYPQLQTDSAGNVKFTFTAPESLTRWNVKMLAHTKDLYFGQGEAQVVTQKDLMVQMNLPRFVRRSDRLVLSANVINLTDKVLTANVDFELIDPATEKPVELKNAVPKVVTLAANETKAVEWELTGFSPYELVICKVVARAGNFSDGEQKYLPVLPDKVLVTESLPLTVRGNQTRTFSFESLLKNGSKVDTKNLSVEFSSNPAWYAVQALPTISTPEDDNALDYFTAYYANSLAAFIANCNPKIAATFDRWKKAGGSREALLSNLEKNAELKNMLLDETPWVMAAKDETEQKRQIALLFDLNMQKNQAQQYLDKLISLQLPSGAFSWFKGMGESRYITQEIVLNLGRLRKIVGEKALASNSQLLSSALSYLDSEIARDFENLKKYNKNYEKEMSVDNMQLFYLHLRSEYPEISIPVSAQAAVKFYTAQSEKYWTNFTLYGKAMMAVVANRNGKTQLAGDILKSLKENALKTDESGMYWAKNVPGYFWNERPIGVQAAIIEAFSEISKNVADVDELKIWLLKQKQTQRWDSPMATVDAIYALLYLGSDWLANEGSVKIKLGNMLVQPSATEAGAGYFKTTIPVAGIRPEMGKVTVSKSDKNIGWGAMYWQYYQVLDKVEGQGGVLKVSKKLFVVRPVIDGVTPSHPVSGGVSMIPIEQTNLVKGDKIITRLVITTNRNLEFVALKDLRASCFEPVNQLSGCEWKEGVCYYQTTKDASTQYFFPYLPKGTYVFEYELWANASGEYTSGIATIQCQYAPEFVSHTGGEKVKIN